MGMGSILRRSTRGPGGAICRIYGTHRALYPLAVLRCEMPLLRLQQPCPRQHRPGPLAATGCGASWRMRRRGPMPGAARPLASIFFGGGTPSLMDPIDRRRADRRCPGAVRRPGRPRGDAGGQPDQRRGGAAGRDPRCRGQPPLARHPGAGWGGAALPRPPARRGAGDGGAGDRPGAVPAPVLRPDLCPAAASPRPPGGRSCARPWRWPPTTSRSTSSPSSRGRASPPNTPAAPSPCRMRTRPPACTGRRSRRRRASASPPTRSPTTPSPAPRAGTTWSTGATATTSASAPGRISG